MACMNPWASPRSIRHSASSSRSMSATKPARPASTPPATSPIPSCPRLPRNHRTARWQASSPSSRCWFESTYPHGLSEQGYDMAEQNTHQDAGWNGHSGERWVAHQVRLDARLAVFGQAAIEAAAPAADERVLDVGCGAGASSLALAARVGAGGQVLGVDISEPLIARARALAPRDAPVLFRVADASSAELPEGAFDILFSRFGVMFFDDPTLAFAHMRRALKPGGRLAFVCWRSAAENDWMRLPMGAIKDIIPPTAPRDPEAPGPFSF